MVRHWKGARLSDRPSPTEEKPRKVEMAGGMGATKAPRVAFCHVVVAARVSE